MNTQFTFSLIEKPQWFYFPFGGSKTCLNELFELIHFTVFTGYSGVGFWIPTPGMHVVGENGKLESFKLTSMKLESFAEVEKSQAKLERTERN